MNVILIALLESIDHLKAYNLCQFVIIIYSIVGMEILAKAYIVYSQSLLIAIVTKSRKTVPNHIFISLYLLL